MQMNAAVDKFRIVNDSIENKPQKVAVRPFYESSIYKQFPLNDAFFAAVEPEKLIKTKGNNKKKISRISAITAGVLIATLAIINRGSFRRVYRRSSELYSDISNRVQSSEFHGQTKSFLASVEMGISRGLKKISDIFKFSANAVAVRDSGVDKALNKTKIGTRFADWTRRVFGKIATNELDRRYDTVERSMRHFAADIADRASSALAQGGEELSKVITIKGKSQTLAQWLTELGGNISTLRKVYDKGFSKDARILRDKVRDSAFADLPERQWRRITQEGGIFDLKKYRHYITEELTAQTRAELANDIAQSRKMFTNNVRHEYRSLRGALRGITDTLRIDDKESRVCINSLRKAADDFRACHGATEAMDRQRVLKNIRKLIGDLRKSVLQNDKYSPDRLRLIEEQITGLEELTDVSGMSAQGTLQRISTILNGLSKSDSDIVSPKEFKHIKKIIHKMTKKLNSATALETDDYFIKRAEIKIGSAPTDIFGLMGPLGLGSYAIARGKTKDEKVEAALTAAVPLVGGIGTYIIGTVKMFNASKNFVFSAITGVGLNLLGREAVKLYRAYQEKQSLVKVAMDSYNSLIGKVSDKGTSKIK